ncbi:hypothetical protein J4G43_043530 [Bradyrhizobium barranii subsp. barranii]|uniref:Uncharacterized protein n=1 Tax=Bradyrhizobium barranii subsp. barranii TaxID=2823807 RepID=A0A939MEQ8_9BRAD|nr:hypothetical protein [Bradyrhizobium barranii]UEM11348.1 hypothetical protein J4G43_043530 [Bradyrhizobium barranii subsp. barranii]
MKDLIPFPERTNVAEKIQEILTSAANRAPEEPIFDEYRNVCEAPPAHEVVPRALCLSPEHRDVLLWIQSGQQKTADEIAELNRNVDAQQAELRRISDQIATLTQRIEGLQNPAPVASPAPAASLPPARTTSKPAKRDVRPSKPQGLVSVGGGPLTAEPSTEQRGLPQNACHMRLRLPTTSKTDGPPS